MQDVVRVIDNQVTTKALFSGQFEAVSPDKCFKMFSVEKGGSVICVLNQSVI